MFRPLIVSVSLFLQFHFHTSFSQTHQLTIPIDVKPEYINMIPDSLGNWNIFMKNVKSYYFLTIDKEGNVIKKNEISRKYELIGDEKVFIGGKSSSEGFYFYFREKDASNEEYFSSYFQSKKAGLPDVHNRKAKLFDRKKETLIKAFSVNNSFYAMVVDSKSLEVKFLNFLDEKQIKTTSFQVDKKTAAILKKGAFRVFTNNKIGRIDNMLYNQKLFVDADDEFVFVDDTEKSVSEGSSVLKFKLVSGEVEKITLPKIWDDKRTTSWYLENHLYTFSTTKDKISFYVVDLATKGIIKQYGYSKGDKITVANDNVIRDKQGTAIRRSKEENLEKDKEIFKELIKGDVFIKISNENDSTLSLFLGSYREVASAENITVAVLAGAALGATGLAIMAPYMGGHVRITWFNTLLSKGGYNVIDSPAPLPEVFRLEEFISRLQISNKTKESLVSSKLGQRMFVGYFDYSLKAIKILEVE